MFAAVHFSGRGAFYSVRFNCLKYGLHQAPLESQMPALKLKIYTLRGRVPKSGGRVVNFVCGRKRSWKCSWINDAEEGLTLAFSERVEIKMGIFDKFDFHLQAS